MKWTSALGALLIAGTSMVVVGCEKNSSEGPAEQAGKALDNAIDKADEKLEEAAKETKEAVKDAADEVKEKVDE